MHFVILGVDIAWNGIVETFTEGGGFVSNHLGNPLLSTCRSDPLISKGRLTLRNQRVRSASGE